MLNERNQTQEVTRNESIYIKFKNRPSMVIKMRRFVTLGKRVVLTGKEPITRGLGYSTSPLGWNFVSENITKN